MPDAIGVDDDGDQLEREADARAEAELLEKVEAADKSENLEITPDEKDPVIDLDDAEEEGEGAEASSPTRKERRRARYDEVMSRNQHLESQVQAMSQQIGQLTQMQQRHFEHLESQKPKEPDQNQARWKELDEKEHLIATNLQARIAGGQLTQEEMEKAREQRSSIQQEKAILAAKMAQGETGTPQPQSQPHQPAEDPRKAAFEAHLEMNYPDVMNQRDANGNRQAWEWVRNYFTMKMREGHRDQHGLLNEAMEKARDQFALRPPRRGEPSRTQRGRTAGIPKGSAGEGKRSLGKIQMTKEYRAMADAAFPNVPKEKRYKHWAKTVGSKLVQK